MSLRFQLTLLFASSLFAAESNYVGSQACRSCHTEIYNSYMSTAMSASSGAVGAGSFRESFTSSEFQHQRSGSYKVESDYNLRLSDGVRKLLSFFVGSGTVARSYLFDQDGFLFQSPVAYYTEKAKWDLSPGYARYDQPFLTRPVLPGCLSCHASGIQHRALTQNGYSTPPFLEGGVSCERCHGPGRRHIEQAPGSIVNPAKLDPQRRDSICAQCHLTGEVRVTREGRNPLLFAAGELLSDYVSVFVRAQASGNLKVTSHVENLAQSACKQASGDRLWCGSCHDPHTVPSANERANWFRQKCLTCHQPDTCVKGPDCATCHMPKGETTDADHVVYTDHSIPKNKRSPTKQTTSSELIPFARGKPADPRDLGIAYAIVGQRSQARTLLEKVLKTNNTDSEALLYLADLENRESRREGAIALYEQAIKIDPAQLTASVSLGAIRMEERNYSEAIRLWKDALRKNPGLLLVRTNLARALLIVGDKQEAQAVVRKAIELNPAFVTPPDLIDLLKAR